MNPLKRLSVSPRVLWASSTIALASSVALGGVSHAAADYSLDTTNLQADVTSNLGAVFAVTLAMVAIPVVKKVIRQARG